MIDKLRNVAIIAHVDHGKTTLVDKLLQQSGTLGRKDQGAERVMDSNDQEKERGITILAKNTAIEWGDFHINIVDTPGHADFGGEVERVLSMVDSVLLLVDAVDGPMPQTRFVTQKAFEQGLRPIVVINKVDRPGARPDWVMDQVFDLFDRLGATDEQLDFPVIYASALNGVAGHDPEDLAEDMTPLFQMITEKVPAPEVDVDGPFQMQISALDYNSYVGVIGIGRISRGILKTGQQVILVDRENNQRKAKVQQVMGHMGLERVEAEQARAGDIVCVTGIEKLNISDTLCDPSQPEMRPPLSVDEPTVNTNIAVVVQGTDLHLERTINVHFRSRYFLSNHLEQWCHIFSQIFRIVTRNAIQGRSVDNREVQLFIGSTQTVEQIEHLIHYPVRTSARAVNFVDNNDWTQTLFESLLSYKTSLRHWAVYCIN